MAPLTKWTTQLMLSFATTKLGQEKPCPDTSKSVNPLSKLGGTSISATSWGFNRMDVYGVDDDGNLAHQYWDGYQWGPKWNETEALGGDFGTPPIAVSPGTGKTDIFRVGTDGSLTHKYYDGTAWQPSANGSDSLGGHLNASDTLSATVNGANPIDVFGQGTDGSIYHKYWDGSSWQPQGESLEQLDDGKTGFGSGPAAVSWGPDRTDIFALDLSGRVLHQYWDGTTWLKQWEFIAHDLQLSDTPTAISWGVNRLDVFGVDLKSGDLVHVYWDGSEWSDVESLGTPSADVLFASSGTVAATSWSANRIDIVALGTDGAYYYKYWDGSQWQPSDKGFISKGGDFASSPAVVSWGENRLDIFGVGTDDNLKHMTWYGSGWYPSDETFETLGEFAVV